MKGLLFQKCYGFFEKAYIFPKNWPIINSNESKYSSQLLLQGSEKKPAT